MWRSLEVHFDGLFPRIMERLAKFLEIGGQERVAGLRRGGETGDVDFRKERKVGILHGSSLDGIMGR